MTHIQEGYIRFKKYKTYYKIVGEAQPSKPPLVVLHGGPGGAHNYMLPLVALADAGYQVIFYDQLGCGKSDMPDDDSLWTIKTFVSELNAVRKHLKLKEINLLGHSWGGMLAIEYMLTKPRGVKSVVLASAMISMPLYVSENAKIREQLPKDIQDMLTLHEKAGTTDSRAYTKAHKVYDGHFIFRGKEFPKEFRTPPGGNGKAAYEKMWGVSEAYPNGDLKNWDRIADLHKIKVPTLVIAGEYDELTPHQAQITHTEIAGSELEIVTGASHCAHVEQPDAYVARIRRFLDSVE